MSTQPSVPPSDRRKQPASGHVVDRRLGLDRRQASGDTDTGLERRRGPGRRRSDFTKSAEEGEMNREQFLFLMAIDAFKRANGKQFPNWTDVLEVIRLLGYRKTMPSELNLNSAEDWKEPANAPANVRPDRWEQRARREEQIEALEEFNKNFGEAA